MLSNSCPTIEPRLTPVMISVRLIKSLFMAVLWSRLHEQIYVCVKVIKKPLASNLAGSKL